MAELLALGVSHKTAPLELRERLALTEGRAAGVLGELVDADEVQEAAAISTCNRTELYLYASDPRRRRVAGPRGPRPRGRHPPDRAGRPPLLAAWRRGRRAALPGHRRPRLDDHRRGRDPGSGQARLRAGPGRGRHRTDPQPPLPRRAGRRQARPLRDRHLRAGALGPLGGGGAGPANARRPRQPPGAGRRRRRDGRAHRPGAGVPRRRGGVHRQPPLRPGDRARAALRRPRDPLRRAPRADDRGRHRRRLDQLPASRGRARGAGRGDGRPPRPAAAADRPGGASRHPSRLPRAGRASASTTWTTCSRWSSATPRAARPRRAAPRGCCAPSWRASSAGSAPRT